MAMPERYVKLILYLVLIVLLNVAGSTFFYRVDLTQDKKYSLSIISKKAVQNLSEPLTVKAFFSSELPSPYNTVERYFQDLLTEYSRNSNANFNFQFYTIGPDSQKEKELASNYGINPVQVQVLQKDELKYKKAYLGAVILHGDSLEKLPTITSTANLEYRLTSAIQNLKNTVSALLNVKKPLQMRLYLSPSLETIAPYIGLNTLKELPETLKTMVSRLNNQYYNKLSFQAIDPSQESPQQLSQFELQELKWPDIPETDIQAGEGKIGLIIKYKDHFRTLSLLNIIRVPLLGTQYNLVDQERLKDSIKENVQSILGIQQNIGYLADHGTPALSAPSQYMGQGSDSLSAFNELISKNYTLQEITLEQGIPEGLSCLIVAGPQDQFSDYELYQIDQALMHGTNLAFFLDSFVQKPQSPRQRTMAQPQGYQPNKTGLERLLSHYGLTVDDTIVLDEHCYRQQLPQQRGGGEQPIYFAPIIKNTNINHDLQFMKNIRGLIGFKMSPVETNSNSTRQDTFQIHELFSSSNRSWLMNEPIQFNPLFMHPPQSDESMQKRPLASLITGQFQSFFHNKKIPAKKTKDKPKGSEATNGTNATLPENQTISPDIESRGAKRNLVDSGQIFLMASSQMLTDTVLDDQGQSPNSVFIMNVIDQLNNRGEMAELRSKVQNLNPLLETSETSRLALKTVNVAGLPIVVILFGLIVWLRRTQRKRKIQSLYHDLNKSTQDEG